MPITPLHFGPALLIKQAGGCGFSLTAFLTTQVLLDIEPGLKLLGLLPESGGLHVGHTGATGAGVAAIAAVSTWLVLRLRCKRPTFWISAASATIGVASHLVLDSIYHADVAAGLGFRGLCGVVSQGWLDGVLLVTLVAGLAVSKCCKQPLKVDK